MKEALVFDIIGTMAHFRRFYSSVTPLSYYFPPRNTVMGMIAAILGYERDSYYDDLSRDRIGIALSVMNEPRKLLLPTNYLDTDNINEDRLRGGSKKPTNIEYVFPVCNELVYRIYAVILDYTIKDVIDRLEYMIKNNRSIYPLSLGSANCLAITRYITYTDAELLDYNTYKNDYIPVSTIIPTDIIADKGVRFTQDRKIVLEERLPPDFGDNRSIRGKSRSYIFECSAKPIEVRLKESKDVFKININDRCIYGTFL